MSSEYIFAVGTIGMSKIGGRKPSTLLAALKHNRREIQVEVGPRGHIDPQRIAFNETIHTPGNACEVWSIARAKMVDAGVDVNGLRKDYTQAIELVFSLPADTVIDDRKFFRRCVEWAGEQFGSANILGADIHRDESTPHCHTLILPLVEGKMQGSSLVSKPATGKLRESFYQNVAKNFALKKPIGCIKGTQKTAAAREVFKELESTQDTILHSSLWGTIKREIERNPAPYVEAMGIELHQPQLALTTAHAHTPQFGRAAAAHTRKFIADALTTNLVRTEISNMKPMGFEEPLENHRNLPCVGISNLPPSLPANIASEVTAQPHMAESQANVSYQQTDSLRYTMRSFQQHPLSAAFPSMKPDEFQDLKDSILAIGVKNPITLFDGMVVDGWHRYKAASELAMVCPTVELDEDEDPVDFVKAQNSARRNMTPSQIAFAYTQLHAWKRAGRPNNSAVTAELSKTSKEIADLAGVGTRTVEQARAVHVGAVTAVQEAVMAGTVSLETAAAVAKLPPERQLEVAAGGPDAMRVVAKSAKKSRNKDNAVANVEASIEPKALTVAEQAHYDAWGDIDPVEEWKKCFEENLELQKIIEAAEADDQKAATIKWKRLHDIAIRRQNELMETVNHRERELKFRSNVLRRIGIAMGEDDFTKLAPKVEAMAKAQALQAVEM